MNNSTPTRRSKQNSQAGRGLASAAPGRAHLGLMPYLGIAVLCAAPLPALAATAPELGTLSSFAVVSETFSNSTAGTAVTGDVCYTTGPATTPAISGATEIPCNPQKGTDQSSALADLNSQSCVSLGAAVALNTVSIGVGPPGEFPPGCYSSTGAMSIDAGTTVTLSGNGVYIFRADGPISTAVNSSIVATNEACANDVYWAPTGATTLGANSSFLGNIFRGTADGLSITLGDSATLSGRALAFGSTVTTDNNTIGLPSCPPIPPSDGGISLTKTITGGNPYSAEGDTISYSLVAENTGSVILTNVTISDPGTVISNCSPAQGSSLNPQDTMNCEGSYTVQQADVDTGTFTNTAAAEGTDPDDQTVSDTDSATATNPANAQALAIPTLSSWAMILLASMLAVLGLAFFRRPERLRA